MIPQGEIGYVFARDGVALAPSHALAANHQAKNFEDVREFPQAVGQKHLQRKVLREGVYAVNTAQFVIITKGVTYALGLSTGDEAAIDAMKSDIVNRDGFTPLVIDSVKDEIGVLTVHDGPGLSTGELIAPVVGQDNGRSKHDNFQDPEAFLACGGSRGRQHQVLADGTCHINRLFATVDMIPKTVIAMGMAGVVISYTGRSGADLSGEDYQQGELVRPSERGV